MITCNNASSNMNEWILDSGESDHMISNDKLLDESAPVKGNTKINLPNGGTAKITHIGIVLLKNGLHLKNVMCVPEFKHNLLSIHKLVRDEKCIVKFQPELCVIQDSVTLKTRALGRASHGLYYLMNDDLDLENKKKNAEVKRNNSLKTLKTERRTGDSVKRKFAECNVASVDQCTLWHNRLGHAPFEKLVKIGDVKFYEHIFPFNKVNSTGSYNTPLPISVHELSHDGDRESGQLAPDVDQISVDDEETGNDPVVNHETEDPDPQ
uniref:Retrovirus-related Pol polyprotein from transposon TNT 1-94-like beta-barrel domain-containing protein n=1 Tax=Chenopodium quinoa TaxID=63459 RepID=A0A803MJC4_CHEQI